MPTADLADFQRDQLATTGAVTIDEALLAGWPVDLSLQATLGQPALQVSNAAIDETAGRLEIRGKASLLGVVDVPVTAVFEDRPAGTAFTLTADMPEAWHFGQSFPALASGFIDTLPIAGGRFVLSSAADPAAEIAAGLNFRGRFSLATYAPDVTAILQLPQAVDIAGPVTLEAAGPVLRLQAPLAGADVPVQVVQLDSPALEVTTDFAPEIPAEGAAPEEVLDEGLSFVATVTIGEADVTIRAPLPAAPGLMIFSAEVDEPRALSLGSLAAAVGDEAAQWVAALPPEISGLAGIGLSSIAVAFDPATKRVPFLSVAVGTHAPWTLFDGAVSIEGTELSLLVTDPLGSGRGFHASTEAVLLFPGLGVIFHVGVELPGLAIEGQSLFPVDLRELLKHFMPAAADLPQLEITRLEFAADVKNKTYAFSGEIDTEWPVNIGARTLTLTGLGLSLQHSGGAAPATEASLGGAVTIDGIDIELTATVGEALVFEGTIPVIDLVDLIDTFLEADPLPPEIPDLTLTDVAFSVSPKTGEFSIKAGSPGTWTLAVGVSGLGIGGMSLAIRRTRAADGTYVVSGHVGGTVAIGLNRFALQYDFPGSFVLSANVPKLNLSPLVQELMGTTSVQELPVPASVLALELSDINLTVAPQVPSVALACTSDLGQTEIVLRRGTDGKWGISAGFAPPPAWKFSRIHADLAPLDDLRFSNTALILSSSAGGPVEFKHLPVPTTGLTLKAGLNVFATVGTGGIGVDELTGLESLTVAAAFGRSPSQVALETAISGSIELADNVRLADTRFRLTPAPNLAVSLVGTVTATLDGSDLKFIGSISVGSTAASFAATLDGQWVDAFGVKGVTIEDVALDLGITYAATPVVGIAGQLQVNGFSGSAAVRFDTANPAKSMIAVAFDRLYLHDVIRAFCSPEVHQAVPVELVGDMGLEGVDLYIAPQDTQIGELLFKRGFTVQGRMHVYDIIDGLVDINVDYTSGILAHGEVDDIEIGGLFSLTGAGDNPKALLDIDLRVGEPIRIDINGAVTLLEMQRSTQIEISPQGFYFATDGKLFEAFESHLVARGETLQGGNFMIEATLKPDLFDYLKFEACKIVSAAAAAAGRQLDEAEHNVLAAQQQVSSLTDDIARARSTVIAERQQAVRDGEADVAAREADLRNVDARIAGMRRTVQSERDADLARLRQAQISVSNAQAKVNSLQSQINYCKRRIAELKSAIDAKYAWARRQHWTRRASAMVQATAYAAAKGAEITALYAKIGSLEAARLTALGVLEAAKRILRLIQAALKTFPIDADPRMLALFAQREVKELALQAARRLLEAARKLVTVAVDLDPRVAGLLIAYGTATLALEAAQLFLDGLQAAVGAVAGISKFIAESGMDGLLDVKSASFSTTLAQASGGTVTLGVELDFMNEAKSLSLPFNFKSPAAAVQDLAQRLLPAK